MLVLGGEARDLRRGWTRRDCLRVAIGGSLGLLGSAQSGEVPAASSPAGGSFGQAKVCIFIYLFGGPSHIDIWDMKPDAPPEIRGEFKPQATNVPGIRITEHLPRLARLADRYSLIRSLTHGDNAHGSAGHRMMTGRQPRKMGEVPPTADDFPHYGAVLARLGPAPRAAASFVQLPQMIATSTNVVPGQNAGFLGRALDPFRLERPGDGSMTFTPPLAGLPIGVNGGRFQRRRRLLEQLELRSRLTDDANAAEMDKLYRKAFRFLDSPETARAFRLDHEPAKVRQRYGMNVFGQSVLLARRLVESGVRMVTVCWPDRTEEAAFVNNGVRAAVPVPLWDMHGKKVGNTPIFPSLRDLTLPALDLASSALLEDLSARGLLEQTLVVWTGEFGRSPQVNGDVGRDHYGNVFSAMLAGGGIRGGRTYGRSDKHGAFPADNPVSPADFAATLYHCLGVAPDAEIADRLGRPVRVVEGRPVAALL
jgi:hypothetical protein